MFIRTLQKLTIPEQKDIVFVSPDYSAWDRLLSENKCATQRVSHLSRSRSELLRIAEDYTRTITGASDFDGSRENVIATGHQPIWHHCGVLAKNSIVSKFAKRVGTGLHIVLDHDVCDTAMVLPTSCGNGIWGFKRVEIECEQKCVPLEFRSPLKTEKMQALINAIAEIEGSHFCVDIWRQCIESNSKNIPALKNVADSITFLQAKLNLALQLDMAYLPISRLSQSHSFIDFATSIIADAFDFVRCYNNAIANLTAETRIRNRRPMPRLKIDYSGNIVELPFWLVSPEGKRSSLYVMPAKNKISIFTDCAVLGDLDSSDSDSGLMAELLSCCDYRLRPKAVTLTLFVRLFLADWFVHGVGGASYESVTDDILKDYYGINELSFGIATATVTLPLSSCVDSVSDRTNQLRQQLRKIKYNPERFIENSLLRTETVGSLIIKKESLIRTTKDDSSNAETKRSAWESILEVNKDLLNYATQSQDILKTKLQLLKKKELSKCVLNHREYFFGLFPGDALRDISQ